MKPADGGDSRARFFPKGFPRLHFSGLYIYPRDVQGFQGFRAPSDGNYIYRRTVRRPANDVVARFQPRYRLEPAPFQRPDSPFSIGSTYRYAPAIRRDLHSGDALGSDGLGISRGHINQVVARPVSGFNPRSQQPFAVRKKTNLAVAHGIVGELPCFARSRRNQAQRSALRRFCDREFWIGRDGHRVSLANARRRRTIGVAQKHGVIRSTAIAFLVEKNLPAVAADIAHLRPPEPSQLALLFAARRHATDTNPCVRRHRQYRSVPQVFQPHAAGHVRDVSQLAREGHGARVVGAARAGGREPYLIARRRP